MRARAIGAVLLCSLAGCGAASDGAALVHGELFAGKKPWDTSLEFTGTAVIHGAGPVRIVITHASPKGESGRGGKAAGLTLELRNSAFPPGGATVGVGGDDGPQATVDSVVEDGAEPTATTDGADVRYSDGGFTVQATGGTLEMDFDGSDPGDGARGQFELVFKTGESVRGTFAAAIAD